MTKTINHEVAVLTVLLGHRCFIYRTFIASYFCWAAGAIIFFTFLLALGADKSPLVDRYAGMCW